VPTGTRGEPPAGYMRVAHEGYQGPSNWAVIHWFLISPATLPTNADMDGLLEGLQDLFQDELIHQMCVASCHYTTTRSTLYLPASQKLRRVYVEDAVGGLSGDIQAAQVSTLIDWDSLDGRRGGKPRSYIPGVPSSALADDAHLDSGTLSSWNTHVGNYLTGVNALSSGAITSCKFVVMSFVVAGAYRATPISYDISGGHVRPVLATQRRRVDRVFSG